jgi:hypothetical protein
MREAPARPAEMARGGKAATEEPAEIIRWIDEIDDAEMNEEIERLRREAAGEPPLPVKPGPRRIYTPTLRKSGKNSLPTAVKAILLHP